MIIEGQTKEGAIWDLAGGGSRMGKNWRKLAKVGAI
jgi:hypothetical protein